MSSETRKAVDEEVSALVTAAYERAKRLLTAHEDKLHKLASALIKEETLSGEQIGRLLGLPHKAAKAMQPRSGFGKL